MYDYAATSTTGLSSTTLCAAADTNGAFAIAAVKAVNDAILVAASFIAAGCWPAASPAWSEREGQRVREGQQ
jgi:hypothetical protein